MLETTPVIDPWYGHFPWTDLIQKPSPDCEENYIVSVGGMDTKPWRNKDGIREWSACDEAGSRQGAEPYDSDPGLFIPDILPGEHKN